jgi:hypothetical protein
MWGKKCDFTVTINKPISRSPTGKGCGLHTKREGKVLSDFETMLVKNMAVVLHLLCLLDVACVVLAYATMRKLFPNCPWNSRAVNYQPTHSSEISFSSGRNTGPLA